MREVIPSEDVLTMMPTRIPMTASVTPCVWGLSSLPGALRPVVPDRVLVRLPVCRLCSPYSLLARAGGVEEIETHPTRPALFLTPGSCAPGCVLGLYWYFGQTCFRVATGMLACTYILVSRRRRRVAGGHGFPFLRVLGSRTG